MKTVLSAFIICIYTLLYNFNSYTSNYIVIEHIGTIDKPIVTIKITDDKTDTLEENSLYHSFLKKHIVELGIYKSLKNIISSAPGNTKVNPIDFGTFEFKVYEKGALRASYFADRKKTIWLFDKLIADLKLSESNQELINSLQTNKKRINY